MLRRERHVVVATAVTELLAATFPENPEIGGFLEARRP
jgi:hypothetical protein